MQIELSKTCPECEGYTYYNDEGYKEVCPVCHELKEIPTESGVDILVFLKKFSQWPL